MTVEETMTFSRPLAYLLVVLLGATLVGCDVLGLEDDDEEIPEFSILDPELVDALQDSEFDVAAAAPRDDQVLAASLGDGDDLDRVVYIDEDQNAATVFVGDDGLPERAVIDDNVLVFSNYTEDTFDIAAITPNGETYIERELELPDVATELLEDLEGTGSAALSAKSVSWANVTRGASLVMDTALCGGAIAAAKPTFGATVPMAISSCGSALLTTAAAVSDSEPVKAAAAGWNFSWCKAGEASACVSEVLDLSAEAIEGSENTIDEREEEVAQTTGALRFAGVWGYPDRDGDWFVVEEDKAFDAFYDSEDDCYSVTIGDYVSVDGNVFTYERREDGEQIDLEYERLEEDELRVERLDPPLELIMSLAPTEDPEDFLDNRCEEPTAVPAGAKVLTQ
jgi:hypothetical protein